MAEKPPARRKLVHLAHNPKCTSAVYFSGDSPSTDRVRVERITMEIGRVSCATCKRSLMMRRAIAYLLDAGARGGMGVILDWMAERADVRVRDRAPHHIIKIIESMRQSHADLFFRLYQDEHGQERYRSNFAGSALDHERELLANAERSVAAVARDMLPLWALQRP
jgi:hypothetical protein